MMRVGLSVEEAVREVLAHLKPVASIEMNIKDSFGYTLAEDMYAAIPVPPFDRAMMDGFAIRSADVQSATPERPVKLRVRGRIGAGESSDAELQEGEAIRIMTGAPIPKGADAVARFEITDGADKPDAAVVDVYLPAQGGESISLTGEDMQAGSKILQKGTVIGPAEMALLATVGLAAVPVCRKPIIGVLSSGSELVSLDQPLPYGKIYNSNSYMLAGLISQWGGIPYLLEQVDDEVEHVEQAIRTALPVVDALVTTGGVSVGDFDVMRTAYHLAGGQIHFWKVNMRPGTPFTFATVQETPIFGLSGNPAAAFVNAVLFLQPGIRALAGCSQPLTPPVQVVLADELQVKAIGMDRFLRAKIVIEAGQAAAYPLPFGQSAGVMSTLAGIQGFIRIPARTEVKRGDLVEAYLLDKPLPGNGQAGGDDA
ncbi:molybdopterin molybdotransferase MoeA [Effusibacillus pohliae]|uniref:molybdopterin molybdotransferase MoeA n=1 Tax=Effusibacillus pohliae TaxID=232270 RepID=UPI000373E285|nr:gephyrin-like molybdotransferase Glp [Effusibacillus pohliae]